jgi:hypothetical protein
MMHDARRCAVSTTKAIIHRSRAVPRSPRSQSETTLVPILGSRKLHTGRVIEPYAGFRASAQPTDSASECSSNNWKSLPPISCSSTVSAATRPRGTYRTPQGRDTWFEGGGPSLNKARLCLGWCNGVRVQSGRAGTVSTRHSSADGKTQRLRGCIPTQLSDVDNFLSSTS